MVGRKRKDGVAVRKKAEWNGREEQAKWISR